MTAAKLIIPRVSPPPSPRTAHDIAADRIRAAKVDLTKVRVTMNSILILPHKLPEKTTGGIYLADRTKDEDRWQGKVGLVLKIGPTAFHDDAVNKFGGDSVKPGDWVLTRATDGYEIQLGGRSDGIVCKLVSDTHIRAVVDDPDMVF